MREHPLPRASFLFNFLFIKLFINFLVVLVVLGLFVLVVCRSGCLFVWVWVCVGWLGVGVVLLWLLWFVCGVVVKYCSDE
ncbi:hypothetical protein Cal7507_1335 [Calothrix sp. PCC 7507]|nr:hypothetical protein Cal7507_1335 [Calothrix sp. PCC 7507]